MLSNALFRSIYRVHSFYVPFSFICLIVLNFSINLIIFNSQPRPFLNPIYVFSNLNLPCSSVSSLFNLSLIIVSNRIIFAGFVSNTEVPYLYTQAIALVMPTYFGPTNLPPLEAFNLNVPVIYSDIPGAKDQLAEAALYCDLTDPLTCANNIYKIYTDPLLKDKLVLKGKKLLGELKDETRISILVTIIDQYKNKINTWQNN